MLAACLSLLAVPAQALVSCKPEPGIAAAPANGAEANRLARLLAGLATDVPGDEYPAFAATAHAGWLAYEQKYYQPLNAWATKEVRAPAGGIAFYPFSGPDLPSMQAVYPAAARLVMVSDQHALRYLDPLALKEPHRSRILKQMGEEWTNFGERGFFVTQELNRRSGDFQLTPTMMLMAFAARLGYEIRSIQPVCLEAADLTIRPIAARDARWNSVRLVLRKEGRDTVIDYLQQDLANRGLSSRSSLRGMIESFSKGPVLLKAASHLPQQPSFSQLNNAMLTHSPLIVQDETGIEYEALAKSFNVRLYGAYVKSHRLFREYTNPSLVTAYRERSQEVRPLNFSMGYLKEAGSAIQVATRK